MFASQIYSHAYLFVCVEVCIVCFVYLFVCLYATLRLRFYATAN